MCAKLGDWGEMSAVRKIHQGNVGLGPSTGPYAGDVSCMPRAASLVTAKETGDIGVTIS
jgi:hypothetical protein